MHPEITTLTHVTGPLPTGQGPLCLILVHNELNILPQFLDHYRAFGAMQFLAIEDRSTDGSRDYLAAQPDVAVFQPVDGTQYKIHKRAWRSEPLDAFGTGRWCLVPDVDEHFMWRDAETRSFDALISDLEAEGAEGLAATMVDMYGDLPISGHLSTTRPLTEDFPYFDDPLKDPLAYRAILPGIRFRRKYPTPLMIAMGGMRDRLFFPGLKAHQRLGRALLPGAFHRSRSPKGLGYARESLIYLLGRHKTPLPPLNLTKLPLVRWRKGGKFNGGTHHLSERLPLSTEKAVLLHFPLTRGIAGIDYIAARGQHASGSGYYAAMQELTDTNPVYAGSTKFTGSHSLAGFFS